MASNRYIYSAWLKVLALLILVPLTIYAAYTGHVAYAAAPGVIAIFTAWRLHKQFRNRFAEALGFFEAVKHGDYTRGYNETKGATDMRKLHKGFNDVTTVLQKINSDKELHYQYLQTILSMTEVGIIAYDTESGNVLWANEAFGNLLELPAFKNIAFVKKRKPDLFESFFVSPGDEAETIILHVKNDRIKVLFTNTVFKTGGRMCRLIVLQNIDAPLNQTEADAWKKLLNVMTHEIMNSIAPIASLAETLHVHARESLANRAIPIEIEDLADGLSSIKSRSEGLLKFASTYRSLSKISKLTLEEVTIARLFESVRALMHATVEKTQVSIAFHCDQPGAKISIDQHLVEQVLINLILNAIDACAQKATGTIVVSCGRTAEHFCITVSDNGTGIPEEIVDSVFIPFFTTKKNGSGIGLSLSRQIMQLHKGKITIRDNRNGGTDVNLLFNTQRTNSDL